MIKKIVIDNYIDIYIPIEIDQYYNFRINAIENIFDILNSYNKDTRVYSIKYDLLSEEDNKLALERILKAYNHFWFNNISYDFEDNQVLVNIIIDDINETKSSIVDNCNKIFDSYSPNIKIDKAERLYLSRIFWIESFQWDNKVYIKKSDFNDFGITLDYLTSTISENTNIDYYSLKKYQLNYIILLVLLCKDYFSKVYLKNIISRIAWKWEYDYLVDILKKKNSISWGKSLNEILSEDNDNLISIKVTKKSKWILVEKEYWYLSSEYKFIDLVKMYPNSQITTKTFFWNINKYFVIEKIKI